jgi:hypothetical protein
MSEWDRLYNDWYNFLAEGYGVLFFYLSVFFLRITE